MITIIGGGLSGLSTAYFLHRAGKDVTVLEWSRGLGGRASTRNIGYRTMDAGAQRIDLSPHSSNPKESAARALFKMVLEERGVNAHLKPFPGPILRFDGRSIGTAKPVEVADWTYIDGGMIALAEALAVGITVRSHTRISDIIVEGKKAELRNQRGEKMPTDGIVLALPGPYALAMLTPHAEKHKKVKKLTDMLNEVQYEPMIGAAFGTTKIAFKDDFSALFSDDVTAPIFWLSQEAKRRHLGVRRNENAFVLQLGAEISRDYVLKTDRETFAAIERVFEEVLDIALPDILYGEIQRWPAAFLESSPFDGETLKPAELGVPLYLAGDYVVGQSSIASAFWSGKLAADKILGEDSAKYILDPAREQAAADEAIWSAPIPPARAPRKPHPKPKKKTDARGKKHKGGVRKGGKFVSRGRAPGGRPQGGRPGGRGGYGGGGGRPQGGRGGGQRQPYGDRQRSFGGPPRQYAQGGGGGGDRRGGGGGGGYQQRGGGGGYQGGGGGGYQGGGGYREGGGGGGYQQRGGGGGGYQGGGGRGGGGYQSGGGGGRGGYQGGGGPPREQQPRDNDYARQPTNNNYVPGGYRPRSQSGGGGYQQRGGGGYQGGGGGGYQGGGGGGRGGGGYQGGGGGGYQGGGGGGYQGGGGGRGGGGGYDQNRDYNRGGGGRDQNQGGGDGGGRRPARGGSLVYSTGRGPEGRGPEGRGPDQGGPNRPPRQDRGGPATKPNDGYGQRMLSAEEEERRALARRKRGPQGPEESAGNR